MATLILDCAFSPTVSIVENNKQVVFNVAENQKHSDNFMFLIDQSLKQAKMTLSDIDVIFINKGPGSFTGLRVAVSIAKGFGFGEKKKFNTFTSFDFVGEKENAIVDGFSNFVYLRNRKGEMTCEDINSLSKSKMYSVYDVKLYEKLKDIGYKVSLVVKRSYEDILNGYDNKPLEICELEPLYLRKSQAELEKENKLNKKS